MSTTNRPTLRVVKGTGEPRPAQRARRRKGQLDFARSVLDAEANAILGLKERVGGSFAAALELLMACPGHVVVTGIGKPSFIAQKLSATLASTGIPSLFLHPSEAVHGDLGRVKKGDVVLALSNSGATEEILRLLPALKRIGAKVIAITGTATRRWRAGRTWWWTSATSTR